jgi:hypothetical protein
MFESLFGGETPLPVKVFIALLIVVGLVVITAWIVRRFGGERLGASAARGRQPRLALIDSAAIDGRRRLILIRRDNVEHLLIIGGPTDVVIEPNIVRAVAAARETSAPARAPAATDTLPRAVPLGDAGTWPLQPEPASRPEPAPRPVRSPVPEEPVQWSVEPEMPPPPAPRRPARTADPLAGLAAELARSPESPRLSMPTDLGGPGAFMPREPARPREREPVRGREAQIEREPIREREPARMREPELARTREPELARMREPELARSREPEPARSREPELARSREPEPARSREPEPARSREPEPARSREPEPARSREPEPARMREPELARSREPELARSREPEFARSREPEPPPSVADTDFNAGADQNLADMAQRLEAALRRPAKPNEARSAEPPTRAVNADASAAPPAHPRAVAPPTAEPSVARGEPKPAKSLYDSLEKEMANLLGRPSGKS